MANPRYQRDERLSSRERKAGAYSDFQQGQQRQQQLNQQGQGDMMRQLQEMYQMSAQQQMDPLKMDALRASTEAQGLANEQQRFQNQWAQPNAEAAYNLAQAQAQGLQDKGRLTDRDYMNYEMSLGKLHPSDPRALKAAQDAEAQRLQAVQAEESRMDPIGPPMSMAPPRTTAFTGREGGLLQNPQSAFIDSVYTPELTAKLLATNQARRSKMSPEQIYNEQHPVDAVWNKIFGKPIQR